MSDLSSSYQNDASPYGAPREPGAGVDSEREFTEVDFINFRHGRGGSRYDDVTDSVVSDTASIISQTPSDRLSKRTILCFRVSFLNVILMGFGFMFNIGAYGTAGMAQTVVLNSVKDDEYFTGSSTLGYVLWAICCGTQALAYLFGPCLVAVTGPKSAMVAGAVCVSLYIACFIRPMNVLLYVGAALLGFGVGVIWVVQQHFITINSTSKRVLRNTGVFWGLYQSSLVTGNMFYFIMVNGSEQIENHTRIIIFGVLTGISGLGILVFALIVHPWTEKVARPPTEFAQLSMSGEEPTRSRSAKEALRATLKVAKNRDMLILMPMFFYIGLEGTFWSNVYGTSLGYTQSFGNLRESLVGLTGVFVGIGEIIEEPPHLLTEGPHNKIQVLKIAARVSSGGFFMECCVSMVAECVRGGRYFWGRLCGLLCMLTTSSGFTWAPGYSGGLLLGFLGKWMHYNGKETILMFALIAHISACYLAFLNTPQRASLAMTKDSAYITPDPYIAMLVAFLFGLGDAIWNSQCMAYLGHVYRHDCVSVFGVYQFWCALTNAGAFLYATVLTLPYQLLILVVSSVIAAAGFCYVEWHAFRTHPPD